MKKQHLTTPQQNIWNLQKYYEDTAISNLCGAIFYKEKRDSALLQQAIRQFIKSQSGLRLRFCEEDEPKQYVSEEMEDAIPIMKFSSKEEFDCYANEFAKKPLGLIEQPMYRFVVFQIENQSGILVVLSHLIADAWTFGLMAKKVDMAYHILAEGTSCSLVQGNYLDFINSEEEYIVSERYAKDKKYWEEKYVIRPEESPIKLCPTSSKSIKAKRYTKKLPLALEGKIHTFCKENPITAAVLFETALMIYLAQINRENRTITIGVPVLNRSNAKEKNIAGMFVSTMPLTVTIEDSLTVSELAKRITKGHMELFRHQKYSYANILKSLREKQNFSGNLYDVMISYQNAKTNTGADTKWYSNGYSEVPFVMHIDNRDEQECHTINIDYQTVVFKEEEIEYLIKRLEYILEQIVEEKDKAVRKISIVPKQETEKMLYDFNDTYVDYPRDKCVHELFTEQAKRTPDSIALIFEDKKFTYRQLDEMSNSLAHFLRNKGINPNDVVPIIAKRSWHVIVAMLGVLKAGGAYMPVDPSYPVDRITYMMEIAESKFALIYGYEKKLNIESMDLGEFDYTLDKSEVKNVNNPKDSVYVIFTSGSTGEPKGITISHQNLGNFVCNNEKNRYQNFAIENGKVILADTIFTFDISVFEIYMSLLNGIRIVLTNENENNVSKYIANLIIQNSIDILQCTPTKLQMLINNDDFRRALNRIKVIMLGAEELKNEIYHKVSHYTNAIIFNGYGPTEITIGASFKKVTDTDITIGKPIANTQIYILGQDNIPLPIGVAGELCIAGDGVGKGYLKRPELTAERFVPNPFATDTNHHGKIMYRTGDLARWRADGEIEYLGRIDTQVKIRGLRIELGEIESVMSSMEGIGLTAVADKRDENNRQYLVGYYTADALIDEKKLRKHLSAKLPKYMVPNYFMHLDVMPMTPSGKTDRKNLPVPDFTVQTTEYVAPVTERERKLCHLLEELLHVEQIGTADDFFELGGDSLTAIEYVAKAHGQGIDFTLQNVFDYPTVQSLCNFIEKGDGEGIHFQAEDFAKYKKLFAKNEIDKSFEPHKQKLGNVLLTGATGFLGAHILDALMKEEEGKIYCLVRSGKQEDRRGRLQETLQYYFGNRYDNEINKRIIPIVGDIEQEDLGECMPEDVQTVIHAAASVKHYGAYDYFQRVNVEGTRHVIKHAKSVGAKLIHISTLSVSGNSLAEDFSVYRSEEEKHFYETSFYIGQPLDNVYVRSKFEAERAVYDAMLEGLEVKVIRVGNLTNRAFDYKFQPNFTENAFLTRVKAVLEFGLFPDYLMPLYAEFSPIDLTADGIIKIAQYADRQCIFHLNSNRPIYFERFLKIVHELGIAMKVVEGKEFNEALQQTIKHSGTEYIFEAFQNDMDENGRLVYDSNIRIENDFTVWFLAKVGFAWNETDEKYIKGYIEYFRSLGYLEV
ncbi:MAG: amino acid adenylation domain-containing protein [Lachnospiraceae bacterium]|nr:amino acid adenylation domain-containing protein [Lachnospiraceae bacterium]